MKIAFHGAARTVTGSKHLISLTNGKKILLDCGMFQGMGKDTDTLNRNFGFNPAEVTCVFLSHAHVDHSGLLPRLVKEGFKGKIYATPATIDVTKVLLQDSAFIQKQDTIFMNKRRREEGRPLLEPLYTEEDAANVNAHFVPVHYHQPIQVDKDIQLEFFDGGHIIGSATVFVTLMEDGKRSTLVFSGDVGRYGDPILHSPETFPQADYIIIESTYGNKVHGPIESYMDDLDRQIQETCIHKKGKLIIPAFSVGRTQELLYALNDLELAGKLPPLKYYLDSPMSTKITEIVKQHPECFNRSLQKLFKIDSDPFHFKGLKYITDKRDSQALNSDYSPMVIISASGMAEAGRVKHHIANGIGNWRNTILIIGYCEPQSLGARLKLRPETVTIYGMPFSVKADIRTIDSMSAHADYNDLCQYLACQDQAEVKRLFIVHGEAEVQDEFKKRLLKKGFKDVEIPELHQEFGISP
ncbi:MBL fold hydrolase [Bacteroidia bacterium]|nr:MBL fold hydrolase [Bacteroidia bacterium]GHT04690.1 MBL fold hydrolase [Bacteroidia bacterium]GHT51107.1 MBL fold hydrolase [Bacteroidia bacterium]